MFGSRTQKSVFSHPESCEKPPLLLPAGNCPKQFLDNFFHRFPLSQACALATTDAEQTMRRIGAWSGEGIEYEKQRYEAVAIRSGRVAFDRPMIISGASARKADFGNVFIGGCTSNYLFYVHDVTPVHGESYTVLFPYLAMEAPVHGACARIMEKGTLREQGLVENMLTGITGGFSLLSHDISGHHLHLGDEDTEIAFSHASSPLVRGVARRKMTCSLSTGGLEAYSIELNREMLRTFTNAQFRQEKIEGTLSALDAIDQIAHKMHKSYLSRPGVKLHLMCLLLLPMDEVLNLETTPEIKAEWKKIRKGEVSYKTLVESLRGRPAMGQEQSIHTSYHYGHNHARRELACGMLDASSMAKRLRWYY